MNSLKLKPLLATFLSAFIVISCAGFAFQYYAKDKPMLDQLTKLTYSDAILNEADSNKKLKLSVKKEASLIDAVTEAENILEKYDQQMVEIQISEEVENESLRQIWEDYLFEIADLMANKKFAQVPQLMEEIEQTYGINTQYAIDEQNIYLTLLSGEQRLDKILPLQSAMMGAWADETIQK